MYEVVYLDSALLLTCFMNTLVKAMTASIKNSINCSGLLSGLINLELFHMLKAFFGRLLAFDLGLLYSEL